MFSLEIQAEQKKHERDKAERKIDEIILSRTLTKERQKGQIFDYKNNNELWSRFDTMHFIVIICY